MGSPLPAFHHHKLPQPSQQAKYRPIMQAPPKKSPDVKRESVADKKDAQLDLLLQEQASQLLAHLSDSYQDGQNSKDHVTESPKRKLEPKSEENEVGYKVEFKAITDAATKVLSHFPQRADQDADSKPSSAPTESLASPNEPQDFLGMIISETMTMILNEVVNETLSHFKPDDAQFVSKSSAANYGFSSWDTTRQTPAQSQSERSRVSLVTTSSLTLPQIRATPADIKEVLKTEPAISRHPLPHGSSSNKKNISFHHVQLHEQRAALPPREPSLLLIEAKINPILFMAQGHTPAPWADPFTRLQCFLIDFALSPSLIRSAHSAGPYFQSTTTSENQTCYSMEFSYAQGNMSQVSRAYDLTEEVQRILIKIETFSETHPDDEFTYYGIICSGEAYYGNGNPARISMTDGSNVSWKTQIGPKWKLAGAMDADMSTMKWESVVKLLGTFAEIVFGRNGYPKVGKHVRDLVAAIDGRRLEGVGGELWQRLMIGGFGMTMEGLRRYTESGGDVAEVIGTDDGETATEGEVGELEAKIQPEKLTEPL